MLRECQEELGYTIPVESIQQLSLLLTRVAAHKRRQSLVEHGNSTSDYGAREDVLHANPTRSDIEQSGLVVVENQATFQIISTEKNTQVGSSSSCVCKDFHQLSGTYCVDDVLPLIVDKEVARKVWAQTPHWAKESPPDSAQQLLRISRQKEEGNVTTPAASLKASHGEAVPCDEMYMLEQCRVYREALLQEQLPNKGIGATGSSSGMDIGTIQESVLKGGLDGVSPNLPELLPLHVVASEVLGQTEKHGKFIDREFQWVYVLKFSESLQNLVEREDIFQAAGNEIEELGVIHKDTLKQELMNSCPEQVPRGSVYIKSLFDFLDAVCTTSNHG
eukprot:GHVQ01025141.1.p1 GENE.GHVQ01025141.1~~GHVQ01025141.1.p1  ORF type:complete len:333 (+),score=50.08 GHVQ01025141.1:1415-2413(+)